uniref:Uncharacterized protein n=1 Tax=Arundo donax TaxID=35708 RepID=A0A0A9BFZ5_ARUDO
MVAALLVHPSWRSECLMPHR